MSMYYTYNVRNTYNKNNNNEVLINEHHLFQKSSSKYDTTFCPYFFYKIPSG